MVVALVFLLLGVILMGVADHTPDSDHKIQFSGVTSRPWNDWDFASVGAFLLFASFSRCLPHVCRQGRLVLPVSVPFRVFRGSILIIHLLPFVLLVLWLKTANHRARRTRRKYRTTENTEAHGKSHLR
jgi:hypothetical protein